MWREIRFEFGFAAWNKREVQRQQQAMRKQRGIAEKGAEKIPLVEKGVMAAPGASIADPISFARGRPWGRWSALPTKPIATRLANRRPPRLPSISVQAPSEQASNRSRRPAVLQPAIAAASWC